MSSRSGGARRRDNILPSHLPGTVMVQALRNGEGKARQGQQQQTAAPMSASTREYLENRYNAQMATQFQYAGAAGLMASVHRSRRGIALSNTHMPIQHSSLKPLTPTNSKPHSVPRTNARA
jgi:hypothetical protein